jgi:serine/threonine-protein kinase
MSDASFGRLEELYAEALERAPDDRYAFLNDACGADDELRREIEELLALHDDAVGFFDGLSGDIAHAAPLELESAAQPRLTIGHYRTTAAIGHGGMGAVYRAERVDGTFDQEVAVKLLHRDMDTPQLRARFVAERQLLAGLSHPNIAHLVDGGVTDEGRPYFVMEIVDGQPITSYCRERDLPVDDRLRLFLDVISAVSYLHRNLVVHRDLKPSNIFVDRSGVVKLLDFGIAKLLDDVPDADGATRTGELLMTPEYAAPEQIAGLPVTTATDVYALGIVLYELLTGRRPSDPNAGGHNEPTRDLPPTPSSLLRAQLKQAGPGRNEQRGVTDGVDAAPAWRRVTGDLDTICLKALRPEPEGRYASAEQLGQDIERHLQGLPVLARKSTVAYRLGKFIQRHRPGAAIALVLAAAIIVGFVRERSLRGEAEGAREQAQIQAARAVAVSGFLGELLSSVDPKKAQGREVTVAEVLDQAAQRISESEEVAEQPSVEAAVRMTIGATYVSLGKAGEAREHIERAFELYGGWESSEPEALAAAAELGVLYHRLGLHDDSERVLRRVLDTRVALYGEEHPDSLKAINHLADLYFSLGRLDEVEPLDRKVLEIRRRVLGDEHPDTIRSVNAVASTLFNRGRYSDAAHLFEEAHAFKRRELGDSHPDTLTLANNLAATYLELGRYVEAETLFLKVLAGRARVLGEEHGETGVAYHNLGVTLAQLGRHGAAEDHLRRAITIRGGPAGSGRSCLFSKSYLADVIRDRGRLADAESLYLETIARQREHLGDEDGDTLKTVVGLAELRLRQGRAEEAERLVVGVLDTQIRVRGESHPDTLTSLTLLARILNDKGRHDEALTLADRAVTAGARALGEDHKLVRAAAVELDRAEKNEAGQQETTRD